MKLRAIALPGRHSDRSCTFKITLMTANDTEPVTNIVNDLLFTSTDVSRLKWGSDRARAFKMLRESRGISVRKLAALLTENGYDATHGLIAKIEDNIATSVAPETIMAALSILAGDISDYYPITATLQTTKSSVTVSLTTKR